MVLGCLIDDKFVHKFFLNWARSKGLLCLYPVPGGRWSRGRGPYVAGLTFTLSFGPWATASTLGEGRYRSRGWSVCSGRVSSGR